MHKVVMRWVICPQDISILNPLLTFSFPLSFAPSDVPSVDEHRSDARVFRNKPTIIIQGIDPAFELCRGRGVDSTLVRADLVSRRPGLLHPQVPVGGGRSECLGAFPYPVQDGLGSGDVDVLSWTTEWYKNFHIDFRCPRWLVFSYEK